MRPIFMTIWLLSVLIIDAAAQKRWSQKDWKYNKQEVNQRIAESMVESTAFQTLLTTAAKRGDVVGVKKYLGRGTKPHAPDAKRKPFSERGLTPINAAIKSGCIDCLEEMRGYMDINYSFKGANNLPLSVACNTSLDMCKTLVEQFGADVNAKSTCDGRYTICTPLNAVVLSPKPLVLSYLLEQGANPLSGYYPAWTTYISQFMDYANVNDVEAFLKAGAPTGSHLSSAMKRGRLDIVKLLVKYGADPNYTEYGNFEKTALYYALDQEDTEMVKFLLSRGADVNAVVIHNGTPTETALEVLLRSAPNNEELIDYIINQGGK